MLLRGIQFASVSVILLLNCAIVPIVCYLKKSNDLILSIVFNATFSNISAISWRQNKKKFPMIKTEM
jgi:hypothetical protein